MALDALPGPRISYGQNPPVVAGAPPADYNGDSGPDLTYCGSGLIDPAFGYSIGGVGSANYGSPLAYGFSPGVNYCVIDQVPTAAATANVAALANVTSGTAMTLVSSSGSGIVVTTSAQFIKPTGKTVPTAVLAVENIVGFVSFGNSGAIQTWDPTTLIARAVSITGSTSGTGGAFIVRGFDYRGYPMAEQVTATAGATTVNGKKAFKYILSVTPQFTDAHNYSVGIADIYGLPLYASAYGYAMSTFANAPVTSPTFVAGVTTTPSATTGDVRGTIVVTSNTSSRLQVMQGTSAASLKTLAPGVLSGLFGATQFTQ